VKISDLGTYSFGFDTGGFGTTKIKVLSNKTMNIMSLQNSSNVDKSYATNKAKVIQEQFC